MAFVEQTKFFWLETLLIAIHQFTIKGGQGMNTGLQDAANLVWKLSSVLNYKSPSTILETYTQERLPVAEHVISFSSNLTKLSGSASKQVKIARILLPTLLKFSIPQKLARHAVMGLSFRYESALVTTTSTRPVEFLVLPGERVRDGAVWVARTGEESSLFRVLRGMSFHCVVWFISDRCGANEMLAGVKILLEKFAGVDGVTLVIVAPKNSPLDLIDRLDAMFESPYHVFLDRDTKGLAELRGAHEIYGVKKHSALMLIRPDLIVGSVLKYQGKATVDELVDFLKSYIFGFR
ncbi:hypothetical protein HK096_003935 [Nowakowskiella sp. JEL0078]|nr:hypothetical protein HK096_003935 [Nowakowskiella sp. JEL0078]